MKFTKYMELFYIDNNCYLFNLNNGALLELDNNLVSIINKNKNVEKLSLDGVCKDYISILQQQEFIVDDDYDKKQVLKNKITYSISKYNKEKDTLKIDFALTRKCNFNCPYCFEKENLSNTKENTTNLLKKTGESIYEYIDKLTNNGVIKLVNIVFYGGEPTIEKTFVIDFINKVQKMLETKKVQFKYVFVTNGYLFDKSFTNKLDNTSCKFVQITIDGEKSFHNNRRTNNLKINTFDTIIENINNLLKNKFYVVIRLNVDRTNFVSVKNFLLNIEDLIDKKFYGTYLNVDVARVFGSKDSYNLYEYEKYREILVDIALSKNLMSSNISSQPLTTFCVAETLGNDIVVDFYGNIYRCWNNVFDDDYKINNINNILKKNCDNLDFSPATLDFVEKYSLNNVNNKYCFECKYCKYCQGLCPAVRKNILLANEKNIYVKRICQKIINRRLRQLISKIRSVND